MAESVIFVESHPARDSRAEWLVSSTHMSAPSPSSPRKKHNPSKSRLATLALELFAPVGFPSSVGDGYVAYQVWDAVQGLCTYLRFTLAIKALLDGLGVGDGSASAIAGSVLWAVKDGTTMVSTLAFSWAAASEMGRNVRQWRLVADVANDIMLALQVSAPMFGAGLFFPLTCLSSVFAAICGVSAIATKTSISEHFAKSSLSDLVTKEGTQETAVHLVGLFWGSLLVQWLGNAAVTDQMGRLWFVFALLTATHLFCSVRAVKTLRFHRVNDIRFAILYRRFCEGGDMSIAGVAAAEPSLPLSTLRFRNVRIGYNLREVKRTVRPESLIEALAVSRFGRETSFLIVDGEESRHRFSLSKAALPVVHVILHPDISAEDLLQARFEAERRILKNSIGFNSDHVGEWAMFQGSLTRHGWDTSRPLLTTDLWRYDWQNLI